MRKGSVIKNTTKSGSTVQTEAPILKKEMQGMAEPSAAAVWHEIPPVYDSESEILILGSFPSVKSREGEFFYHHPQNRFWKVLAGVLQCELPVTIAAKKQMLLSHHIAVWDVIESCSITGSSDSSIRNVTVNDLDKILTAAPIKQIYMNGGKAYALYEKYCRCRFGREAVKLPSTSPANAAFSLERLIEEWGIIREKCGI